ncbi:unnamed protein product [Umbelopsis ramanniana]
MSSSRRRQKLKNRQYGSESQLTSYNKDSGRSNEEKDPGSFKYSSQTAYQSSTQENAYYPESPSTYVQQQHRYGGGYQEKVYIETMCTFVATNDVYPLECPIYKPGSEQQPYKPGYEPLYPTSDNQLACTPPNSPDQHHNKHNCVLRHHLYPASSYQQGFQLTDTTSKYSNDYSQACSRSDGNSIEQYPSPPVLPIYSLYTTPSWSSTSSQRHDHHPLPVLPPNEVKQKALSYPPPIELSHKYAETENLSQSPSSLFCLPEKEPHYYDQAAPINPIICASGPAPEVPIHLTVDTRECERRELLHSQNFFGGARANAEENVPHSVRAWAPNVPEELRNGTPKHEIARQEAIYEIVYSEEQYNNDLKVLHEFFMEPLRNSSIIDYNKRDSFIKEVFNNCQEILQISTDIYKDLRDRQGKYDKERVPEIGDVLLRHLPSFVQPYKQYGPHFSFAELIVQYEAKKNLAFAKFIKETESRDIERTRRLPFRHFLIYPVTRMQRYPLLLDAVLKKTPEDHPDHANLTACLEIIRGIATDVDKLTAASKQKLRVLQLNEYITFKQGETVDLQLTDPQRQLFFEGDLKRRKLSGLETTEKQDLHVFLFDHVLLITKLRKGLTHEEYVVWRPPIPLQLLSLQKYHNFAFNYVDAWEPTFSPLYGASINAGTHAGTHDITIQHLGQGGKTYYFYVDTPEEKQQWKEKIDEAKEALGIEHRDLPAFRFRRCTDPKPPRLTVLYTDFL